MSMPFSLKHFKFKKRAWHEKGVGNCKFTQLLMPREGPLKWLKVEKKKKKDNQKKGVLVDFMCRELCINTKRLWSFFPPHEAHNIKAETLGQETETNM